MMPKWIFALAIFIVAALGALAAKLAERKGANAQIWFSHSSIRDLCSNIVSTAHVRGLNSSDWQKWTGRNDVHDISYI